MARSVADRRDAIPVLAELFREYGFAGASLSEITKRTGLGKGSLYHLFPDGKEEMARAVLEDVAGWFETNVFMPLREGDDPTAGIDAMFRAVIDFFHSGRRVCLVGTFALDDTRERFAIEVQSYFTTWIRVLSAALKRSGFNSRAARETAEDVVAGIQGALVLARSQDDPAVFMRAMKRLHERTRIVRRDTQKEGGIRRRGTVGKT
ncbi:MAG: TetR/AcrR family transcriptional regulator [Thiobacillus sp.]|nr:TetR/AcrR family transcriptional regulator [Thiobacillus sp.]